MTLSADHHDTATAFERHSRPSRLADPGSGITTEELQLATRNSGMPLEMLRHDITPVGMHYLLAHYDIPPADSATWQLRLLGVDRPVTLSLDELRSRPRRSVAVTLECAGNGRSRVEPRPISNPWGVEAVGTAQWTGTPLAPLLRETGLPEDAVDVVFTGADHGVERGVEQDYQRALPLAEALTDDILLAYEMNDAPLLPQHGAPLRLVVPGWYGMAHVKWLREVEVLDSPFTGFQNAVAYRRRIGAEDDGEPITRIEPRALIVPPGFPDYMSRTRFVDAGHVQLSGRAWSGWAPVTRVEVSTDAGSTWTEAELGPEPSRWTWRGFQLSWDASPGEYTICARAYDGSGRVQPVAAAWNRGGFANNGVQQILVVVLDR